MAAPVITIYRNGDTYQNGKRLVLNRKEIRSFDAFLDRVTKDTRSQVAVRSIRTPSHGHRVSELDKLENGGIYVAVGPERFKKLEYKEISNLPTHKQKPPEQLIKPVVHSRVIVSGRARKVAAAESSSNKTIFVFRNGDDKQPSTKIHLDKRILHTGMDTILQFITEKVRLRTGAVRSLFTLDGIEVLEPSQLKGLEKYVAVGYGKKFLKMAYNENGATSMTPRRGGIKVKSTSSEPPHRKKRVRPPVKALSQGHVKTPIKNERPLDDKDEISHFTSGKEPSDAHSIESEKQNNENVTVERSLTQDLTQPSSRAETKEDDNNQSRKVSNAEEGRKSSRKGSDADPENASSRKQSTAKEDKEKTAAEKRKAELRAKLKGESQRKAAPKKSSAGKEKGKEEKEEENEKDDIDNDKDDDSTVFKATGDQGERAEKIKDNEETSVEKPLDMLPAEEVEEELETNDAQNDDAGKSEDASKDEDKDKDKDKDQSDGDASDNAKPTDESGPSETLRDSLEEGSKPE